MSTPSVEIVARALRFGKRTAIMDGAGALSYADVAAGSMKAATLLRAGRPDLDTARVAILAPPGRDFVFAQWGAWLAGGIAVPLCLTHPRAELEYVLSDSTASILVAHPEYEEVARQLATAKGLRLIFTTELRAGPAEAGPVVESGRPAMLIYTSGTTGKPKGVVLTHGNIAAQVVCLVNAWEWVPDDHILHVLPLHHLHGLINVLACALWAGAICELLPRFEAKPVWQAFQRGQLTLFMAVPLVYKRLIATWEEGDPATRAAMTHACGSMRLMVCGSAALPEPLFRRWQEISGHTLLERYGMSEIGMALANPLRGERLPGRVGYPLAGIEVRLVDETGKPVAEGENGEIEVRGPGVFTDYWGRPTESANAFRNGWFCTGDIAVVNAGVYRILGRNSVDIIKTGAYKVSALEIEQELLSHPAIEECAVVGVPDEEWGERVCAAVKWRNGESVTLEALRTWCKERLAVYKIPRSLHATNELPRNAMGKVTKKEVQSMFAA
ncbi:MAG: hypothetical protein RIQ93_343 [Verrucomicrobiota bacterium]